MAIFSAFVFIALTLQQSYYQYQITHEIIFYYNLYIITIILLYDLFIAVVRNSWFSIYNFLNFFAGSFFEFILTFRSQIKQNAIGSNLRK